MSLTVSNRRFVLPWLVAAIVCGCFARAGLAADQQSKPEAQPAEAAPAEEPPSIVRIFRLKYPSSDVAVTIMAELVPEARMTVDARSNSIIVAAPQAALQRVEELIATLDVPPASDQSQLGQLEVYPLQHVDAVAAVRTLELLMLSPRDPSGLADRVRIDADPKANRLLVYAPLEVQVQVKELLEKLDAPPEPSGGRQFKVFQLVHTDAATVAETVSRFFDAEEVTVSVDPTANRVLAKGPEAVLEVLEALLLRLDEAEALDRDPRASTTYHVRVVWLASGLPEGAGTEPADDLSDVLAELAKVGVTGARQVGQVMIYTLPDGRFEITCSPMLDEASTEMGISGELQERHGTPYLDIQLSAKQQKSVPFPFPPDRPESGHPTRTMTEEIVNLVTKIAAPYGHYVVLGVTPVRQTTSVFVVRVTESDPVSGPPAKGDSPGR